MYIPFFHPKYILSRSSLLLLLCTTLWRRRGIWRFSGGAAARRRGGRDIKTVGGKRCAGRRWGVFYIYIHISVQHLYNIYYVYIRREPFARARTLYTSPHQWGVAGPRTKGSRDAVRGLARVLYTQFVSYASYGHGRVGSEYTGRTGSRGGGGGVRKSYWSLGAFVWVNTGSFCVYINAVPGRAVPPLLRSAPPPEPETGIDFSANTMIILYFYCTHTDPSGRQFWYASKCDNTYGNIICNKFNFTAYIEWQRQNVLSNDIRMYEMLSSTRFTWQSIIRMLDLKTLYTIVYQSEIYWRYEILYKIVWSSKTNCCRKRFRGWRAAQIRWKRVGKTRDFYGSLPTRKRVNCTHV